MGIDADGAVAVHHASLPPGAPALALPAGGDPPGWRRAGAVAARIVDGPADRLTADLRRQRRGPGRYRSQGWSEPPIPAVVSAATTTPARSRGLEPASYPKKTSASA